MNYKEYTGTNFWGIPDIVTEVLNLEKRVELVEGEDGVWREKEENND